MKLQDFWISELRDICREIYETDVREHAKYEIYSYKYPQFKQTHPELFAVACHPNTSYNELQRYISTEDETTCQICKDIFNADWTSTVDAYKRRYYGKKYPIFKYYKPKIFKKVCNPNCEYDDLMKWIDLVERVENEEISQEYASYLYGDMINKTYIPENLKPRESNDYIDEQHRMKRRLFDKKYPDFEVAYPELFNSVCNPQSTYNDIKNMITSLEEKELSQDTLDTIRNTLDTTQYDSILRERYPFLYSYCKDGNESRSDYSIDDIKRICTTIFVYDRLS